MKLSKLLCKLWYRDKVIIDLYIPQQYVELLNAKCIHNVENILGMESMMKSYFLDKNVIIKKHYEFRNNIYIKVRCLNNFSDLEQIKITYTMLEIGKEFFADVNN